MTIIECIFLLFGGMPLFDALTTSFSTAGTGGYGIKNDSFMSYSPYLQWVVTIFMLLFGINFNAYYLMIFGFFKKAFSMEEVRVYLGIIVIAILIIFINIFQTCSSAFEALTHSAFQVSSLMTSTGFSSVDFNLWPQASKTILVLLMFVGACAGSTGGGIKVSRIIILFKNIIKELNPKYVLIENVIQQLKTKVVSNGRSILIPDLIRNELGKLYNINENQIMNTEKLGVPQKRIRAIFLLVRKDLNIKWEIPNEMSDLKTVRDAIGDLPSLDPYIKEAEYRCKFPDYELKKQDGLLVSKWHYARPHVWRNVEVMMHTPTGKSAKKNPIYYPKNKNGKLVGGSGSTYMRMDWDKPAPTVTTYNHTISSFQNVHPGYLIEETGLYSDPRVLTIFELMRIMTLPDNWDIPDWASEHLIRTVIGEGVPPLAIKKIVQVLNIGVDYDA